MTGLPWRHVHLIGIGGSGMAGIALLLREAGHQVSGSDLKEGPILERLRTCGIRVYVGHSPEHVGPQVEAVGYSSAVPPDNPERLEAQRRGLPCLERPQLLGRLLAPFRLWAVAGTHGKTTTTALLALLLRAGGKGTGFLVGGEVPDLGGPAALGEGELFVVEADEYARTFLHLSPYGALVTNVDHDHVDCYPTLADVQAAFRAFLERTRGPLVLGADSPPLRELAPKEALLFGLGPKALWRAEEIDPRPEGTEFTLVVGGQRRGRFLLGLPGLHNLRNALGAMAAASLEGVPLEAMKEVLARFRGARRRFEPLGQVGGALILRDYAHHPTEVAATLAAARQRFPGRRLVAVFQPHTYSRTRAFAARFAQALAEGADLVLVTEIYPAREADPGDVRPEAIVAGIPGGLFGGDLEATARRLQSLLRPGDVLLLLGAGDVDRIGDVLLSGRRSRTR